MSTKKIQTKYGPVKGISQKTDEGQDYFAFSGIPYAKPPFESLRFRDPEPVRPWKCELDCTRGNQMAHQAIMGMAGKPEALGNDHCLVLNVYSPKLDGEKLPVFVWIHGGGFSSGSNSNRIYGPDYFVEQKIVVVTINYRLGVVGFLSFKDESLEIPGNAGLKDQYMALCWVKENVEFFGGDADNITVGGESVGAASTHFHMMSPMSKGLFHRAILQSGSGFHPWASLPDGETYEYELARALGWNGRGGDRGAYSVIASTEISKLVLTAYDLIKDSAQKVFGSVESSAFLPRVEPYKSRMCFLPKPILELSREAWSNHIHVFLGANKDEGMLFERHFKACSPMLQADLGLLIPCNLRPVMPEGQRQKAIETFRRLYFENGETPIDMHKFCEMVGDLQWFGGYRFGIQRAIKGGPGKNYQFYLATSADPEIKFYKILRNACNIDHLNGTTHADDLPLLWKCTYSNRPEPGHKIYSSFVKFMNAYASFIRTGDPNNPTLGVTWRPYGVRTSDGLDCVLFTDDGVECVPAPNGRKLLAWESIFELDQLM